MMFSGGIQLKKSLIALLLGVALLSAALPAFAVSHNYRRHHRPTITTTMSPLLSCANNSRGGIGRTFRGN